MGRIVIFEGPDRSGKTTIANAVAKHYDTEVFMTNSKECFTEKAVFAKDSSAISLFNYKIAEFATDLRVKYNLNKPIIIYRSFLSEMVYSKLLGRKTDENLNFLTDYILSQVDSLVVLCKNTEKTIHNDDILDDLLINRSIELYEKFKNDIVTEVLEIDTKEHDVHEYVKQIVSHIEGGE